MRPAIPSRLRSLATLAGLAGLLAGACGTALGADPEILRVSGCGTDLATFRLLGEAFRKVHPDTRVEVLPSLGSAGGIKAVAAGALDLGLSTRPLTGEEGRQGVTAVPYARTPLVVAVPRRSRTTDVTTRQLADLYAGVTRTWADGTPVRLVLRPATDTDTSLLMTLSPEVSAAVARALAREGLVVAATDQEAADTLEKVPGALGSTTLALIRAEGRRLTPLRLNGVTPSPEAVGSGRYPLAKTLYLVLGPSPAGRRFLAFLGSPEARRILEETGHVPLPLGSADTGKGP
ncbi:MAG: substrate-binding domain-containing protein [Deltaproteobacteria bacterium]|nr:substrate-binding domain-containing protein [Deltaproteobacteria bacterium]